MVRTEAIIVVIVVDILYDTPVERCFAIAALGSAPLHSRECSVRVESSTPMITGQTFSKWTQDRLRPAINSMQGSLRARQWPTVKESGTYCSRRNAWSFTFARATSSVSLVRTSSGRRLSKEDCQLKASVVTAKRLDYLIGNCLIHCASSSMKAGLAFNATITEEAEEPDV